MYLFVDTETGGLDTDHSLLTVSAIVTDAQFNIIPVHMPWQIHDDTLGCLYLQIKHDTYTVNSGALKVNKIDLVQHDESGVTLNTARDQFRYFVEKGIDASGRQRLIPAGHNLPFDTKFICEFLMPENVWRSYCTYPALDTAVIARFLTSAKLIGGGCSLPALRQYFEIDTGRAHNAEVDNLATIELAKRFIGMLAKHTQK